MIGSGAIWTTNTLQPNDGAFGTLGSISGNTINGTIDSSTFTFTSSTADHFSLGSSNDQLARYEEDISSNLSFQSSQGLENFAILIHNIIDNRERGETLNYIGNFTLTFGDGSSFSNVTPILSNIGSPSEFAVNGIDQEPTGLNAAFDDSQILTLSSLDPDGAGPAPFANYLSDSDGRLTQASGILRFDESLATGGIQRVDYTYVAGSDNGNTAFIGFAGTSVPEPSSTVLLGLAGLCLLTRHKR